MKKVIIIVFAFVSFGIQAQQDAQYTQYMYNTVGVNPAYAGNRGALSITGLHRSQWVGLDGAPETQTLSINTPFKDSRVGLGLSFSNDIIGPTEEQYLNIDFSYTIPTSEEGRLSFGIKGVANFLKFDHTKLTHVPDVNLQSFSKFQPNFGVGAYYHSADKWYLGISAPNILETNHYDNSISNLGKERMNYYLIGGYVFDLSSNIKLKPAVLFKHVTGAPLQADLSANIMFNEKFIIGGAYRWDAAFSGMAGFQMNKKLFLGYGYDMDSTELSGFNSGSHEIILRFELFNDKDKLISPRFF